MRNILYLVLMALGGCAAQSATGPSISALGGEPVNPSYRNFAVAIPVLDGSSAYHARFYLRSRSDHGKLGVCGLYILDAPAAFQQGVVNAFADERSWVSVSDRKVATLGFLPGYSPMTPEPSRTAGCIRTDVDWEPAFADGKFRVGWPAARRF